MNIAADGLCVEKVHVWRGDRHVLKGVSLEVRPGELLHVSGANGTGKTTLLRVITGLLRPEQGSVAWRGKSIMTAPASLVIVWRPGRTPAFIVMNLTTSSSLSPPDACGSLKEARTGFLIFRQESHISGLPAWNTTSSTAATRN